MERVIVESDQRRNQPIPEEAESFPGMSELSTLLLRLRLQGERFGDFDGMPLSARRDWRSRRCRQWVRVGATIRISLTRKPWPLPIVQTDVRSTPWLSPPVRNEGRCTVVDAVSFVLERQEGALSAEAEGVGSR